MLRRYWNGRDVRIVKYFQYSNKDYKNHDESGEKSALNAKNVFRLFQ